MVILGLHSELPTSSGTRIVRPSVHDSNATLIKDSIYIGSVQEERFSRNKYEGKYPKEGLNSLLKRNSLTTDDVNVVYYVLENYVFDIQNPETPLVNHNLIETSLKSVFKNCTVKFIDHHLAHSMGAFLTSGFKESNLLSLDGAGSFRYYINNVLSLNEKYTTKEMSWGFFGSAIEDPFEIIKYSEHIQHGIPVAYNNEGQIIKELLEPKKNYKYLIQSLGSLFSFFSFIAFKNILEKHNKVFLKPSDYTHYENISGKVMGLKGYGSKKIFAPKLVSADRYSNYDMPIFTYNFGFMDYYDEYLRMHEPEDIAFWLQDTFENVIIDYLKLIPKTLKKENLCFSGGCALNILLNEKILKENLFKNVHIHPSTSDAGLSLGAALLGAKELNLNVSMSKNLGCVGLDYNKKEIDNILIEKDNKIINFYELLKDQKLTYNVYSYEEIYERTSLALENNQIVGWFQGKSEYGPRALGNRSILANPCFDNKTLLNEKVKVREFWRPYAAVVMKEHQDDWFDISKKDSYYMLFGGKVKAGKEKIIQGVTHVDMTCRIQTVDSEMNSYLYNLLKVFYNKTSVPVLLNTSFNTLKGEPIVETPVDAVRSFVNSKMDLLIINNMIITKI